MSVFVDDDPSVQSTGYLPSMGVHLALTQKNRRLNGYFLYTAQARDNALFVHDRIGVADSTAEVRFQVLDWEVRGYQV
jgi:hypothetical protein